MTHLYNATAAGFERLVNAIYDAIARVFYAIDDVLCRFDIDMTDLAFLLSILGMAVGVIVLMVLGMAHGSAKPAPEHPSTSCSTIYMPVLCGKSTCIVPIIHCK